MQRAQRRGACLNEKFWWRRDVGAPRDVAPPHSDATDEYHEMSINDIVNGKVNIYLMRELHAPSSFVWV